MVSKKNKEYIKKLEDIIESQKIIIDNLVRNNAMLINYVKLIPRNDDKYYMSFKDQQQYQQEQQMNYLKQQQQQEPVEIFGQKVKELHENMDIQEYLKFGLNHLYGKIMIENILKYINNNNLYFYFKDKLNIKNLLLMGGSSEKRADYLVDWLIQNKHYVKNPIGFLCEDS